MATKTFKIGLSATDKTNMAQDIREEIEKMLFDAYSSSSTYEVGDYVVYNDTLYRCTTAVESAESFDSDKWTQATLQDLVDDVNGAVASVNNKANVDGYYETLTSGNALQLVSKTYSYDQTAYNFRTSGGDNDIGNQSRLEKLVGGTLNFNQLVPDNYTFAADNSNVSVSTSDGKTTIVNNDEYISGAYISVDQYSAPQGHVILYSLKVTTTENIGIQIGLSALGQTQNVNGTTTIYDIQKRPVGSSGGSYVLFGVKLPIGKTIIVEKPNAIDLTAMFGSDIADDIYYEETNEAGKGVAWFKNLFPLPYYAYQTPVLLSTKASKKTNVGFNAFDGELEQGYWVSTTGQQTSKGASSNFFRCSDYIKVVPSQKYLLSENNFSDYTNKYIIELDANKVVLKTNYISSGFLQVTLTSNTHYIVFQYTKTGGISVPSEPKICFHLTWSNYRNGEYEPYVKYEYDLPNQVLRGIPKLDEKGNLYFDGDYIEPDGTKHKRFEKVDLGSLTWLMGDNGKFRTTIADAKSVASTTTLGNILCTKYVAVVRSNQATNTISIYSNEVMIYDTNYTDAATFTTAMSGVYLVYELASEEISTVDEYTEVQVVDDFGTEDYTCIGYNESTNADSTISIPCGNYTRYANNLRDKLQRLPDMPDDTGYYVVYYNDTPDFANGENFCTFYNLPTWLSANGYGDITGFQESIGGTLRQLLVANVVASGGTLDFDNTAWVDLGTVDWTYVGDNVFYCATIPQKAAADSVNVKSNILCTKYKTTNNAYANSITDKSMANQPNTAVRLFIKDTSYSDATAFKTAMKGIILAYEKA